MTPTPCGNLIARREPECALGRKFPEDCCDACYEPGVHAEERTRCEVWTRVMGYHRPVHAFNPGKQQEHRDRKAFREHD